jgi:hypothetical protein
MRVKLENSLARNSFKGGKFVKNCRCRIPTQVVHLCNKIHVIILKMKGRKNEKPKLIARFKTKNKKMKKKCRKKTKNSNLKKKEK